MARKAQSAMEYLTTYGWAIVAIAVGLGVLYSLGVFGIGANGSAGCSVVPGFSCSKPVLYSSGVLNMGLGQIGGTKTITATGCSSNSTSPTVWESANITLQSGQIHNFTFQCPVIQGSKVGTLYKGTLWIEYSSSGQLSSVTQQVGAVQISVQASGVPGAPANSIGYSTVTLSNQQSSPTGSNFQDMLTVPSSYASYESSDLGNIRFYQGGQELYSWCESGCSAGSGAVFWINLPSGIAANSNLQILMVFESNSIEYDGVYAGEAPQLSAPYSKYDNGARVFSYYQNFEGQGCPSNWSCSGDMISNGIVQGGYYYSATSVSNLNVVPVPGVADVYAKFTVTGTPSLTDDAYIYGNPTNGNGQTWVVGYPQYPVTNPTQPSFEDYVSGGVHTDTQAFSPQPAGGYHIWTYVSTPTGRNAEYDYGSALASGTQMIASPIGFYAYNNDDITISAYWARVRAYPPGGIMPSATFGGVATS